MRAIINIEDTPTGIEVNVRYDPPVDHVEDVEGSPAQQLAFFLMTSVIPDLVAKGEDE